MDLFEIDPDIRKARTISSEFYASEEMFDLAKELIFARTWQFAGRAEEISMIDPLELLPGVLNAPLLRVKDEKGVRCLSNVCTHRGMILVENAAEKASLIRCPYHGRRFDLNGKFLSMPEFDAVEDFPTAEDDLRQVPLESCLGFLFASLEPAAPLIDFVGKALDSIELKNISAVPLFEVRSYEFNANWALYCENYLEGFHIPYVHPSLNVAVDFSTYTTELFRYSSLQTGYDAKGNIAGQYLFIFPNIMFNFYPWGLSINFVRPRSATSTSVKFLTYVTDHSIREQGAGSNLHQVEMEDEAVVCSVQRGVSSRLYDRGRYSPTREQGTHHFHRLIAEFMGQADTNV